MRIWERLKLLVPLLMAMLAVADASAQQMAYPSYGAPAFLAGPGNAMPAYQGMPQSFQSHPGISPFDHAMEQTFNSDGLWFRRAISGMTRGSDYYFNVNYIRTKTRRLKGIIGDQFAPTPDDDTSLADTVPGRDISDTFPDTLFLPSFPHVNSAVTGDNFTDGVELSGGRRSIHGWEFSWNVGYNGQSKSTFDARNRLFNQRLHSVTARLLEESGGTVQFIPTRGTQLDERRILETQILNNRVFDSTNADDFGVLGTTEDILDRQLYPYGSIGLQTGEDVDGVSQMFDLDFAITHEVESYGAGFHVSSSPIHESDSFKIRPVVGGRFFRLHEGFHFRGVDSGLDYTASTPDGIDDDDDFVVDNVDENGTLNFADLITTDTEEILVRSFTSSVVRSTMAGPEIGIDYELGDKDGIRVTGATKVAAMVNTERISLAGDNIGDTFAVEIDATTGETIRSQMFDTSTAGGGRTMNFFTDNVSSTHISPLFEQSFKADVPIFSQLPVFRDIWQLEGAKLQVGYTFTWIGEVASPDQSIVWVSNPIDGVFPFINTDRSSFEQHQLNLGINWNF